MVLSLSPSAVVQEDPWITRMNESFDRLEAVYSAGFDRLEASVVKLAGLYGVTFEFPSTQNSSFADRPSHHAISEPAIQPWRSQLSPFSFSNSADVKSFSEEENQASSYTTPPPHLSTKTIFSSTILEEHIEEQISDMLHSSNLEDSQPSLCQEVLVLTTDEEHQNQSSSCVASSCKFSDDLLLPSLGPHFLPLRYMAQPIFCDTLAIASPFSVFDTSIQVQNLLYLHGNIVKIPTDSLHDPKDMATGFHRIHLRLIFDPGSNVDIAYMLLHDFDYDRISLLSLLEKPLILCQINEMFKGV